MMEEYPDLRARGLGPADIAKQYGYSPSFVRNVLGEIADMHGVTRDSLLLFPHNISEEGKAALIAAARRPRKRVTEPSTLASGMPTGLTVLVGSDAQSGPTTPLEPSTPCSDSFDPNELLEKFSHLSNFNRTRTERANQSTHDRIRDIEIWRRAISL